MQFIVGAEDRLVFYSESKTFSDVAKIPDKVRNDVNLVTVSCPELQRIRRIWASTP